LIFVLDYSYRRHFWLRYISY